MRKINILHFFTIIFANRENDLLIANTNEAKNRINIPYFHLTTRVWSIRSAIIPETIQTQRKKRRLGLKKLYQFFFLSRSHIDCKKILQTDKGTFEKALDSYPRSLFTNWKNNSKKVKSKDIICSSTISGNGLAKEAKHRLLDG